MRDARTCPDFAAEHADISTGGIGAFNDWTLTIVRTDKGRELLQAMIDGGAVETRPGDDDPGAIALLHRLARVSRKRWPETAVPDAAPPARHHLTGRDPGSRPDVRAVPAPQTRLARRLESAG